MTRRRGRRSAGALTVVLTSMLTAVSLLVSGCATVPASGLPVDYTQVAEPANQAKPTAPDAGLGPLEIVRGFINANARIDQDPQLLAAGSYLAQSAQTSWQSGPSQVMILTGAPRLEFAADRPDEIQLSGSTDGYLDADGSYVATARVDYQVVVGLVEVDGEWRISAPPPQLIMSVSDFNLAYTQRQVYFLNSVSTLVVPDRRWLPNRSQYPATMASDLIDRLIAGPTRALAPAVHSALTGAKRRAPIVANAADGVLEVDLTDLAQPAGSSPSALAAQLVYTLRADAANIRILVDGVPLDPTTSIWTTTLLGSFDPDVVPGSSSSAPEGYYLTASGALHTLRDDAPVWGTAGTDAQQGVSAAMSAASGDVAIVGDTAPGEQSIFIGSPSKQQPMEERLTAPGFTPPSFSRSGDEVWSVSTGTVPEVVRLLTAGGRYPVDATSLAALPPLTGLAISPDGVRVAIIADTRLYLASVVYTGPDSAASKAGSPVGTATLNAPTLLRNDLMVKRVIWSDSQNLLVAAYDTSSTYRTVWRVGLDGRQRAALSTRGIFSDVDAIAASPSLPTLISTGGRILQLAGDDTSGDWVPAGSVPVAGTWPLYPT